MGVHLRRVALAVAVALIVWTAGGAGLAAGSEGSGLREVEQTVRHDTGQDVAPAFEGWERKADGSYDFVFGYLNRNYEEQVDIALGPENSFDSGPQDRGQPTHFYVRRQRFIFRVAVPREWEKTRRLTWTLTSHGRTNQAKGWLQPEWELSPGVISENNGGGVLEAGNKPPTASGGTAETVTLRNALTLSTTATDDGLPKPRPRRTPSPDALAAVALNPDTPVRLAEGLRIRWTHYRGAGTVAFDPDRSAPTFTYPTTQTTSVRFSAPGTYVVRAFVGDGQLETTRDITVTVTPASP
jgi:hypothetical protein